MIDGYSDEVPGETPAPAAPKRRAKREQPKPTLGRIIHVIASPYLTGKLNAHPGSHLAAIVTGVWEHSPGFNATVFSPFGNQPVHGYPLNYADEGETWHWPERES